MCRALDSGYDNHKCLGRILTACRFLIKIVVFTILGGVASLVLFLMGSYIESVGNS